MSEERFDVLARSLGNATSRRQVLKVLVGSALGGLGVLVSRKSKTEAATQARSHCTKEGAMRCRGTGFVTCDHGVWVKRACAPGTVCRRHHGSILCDRPR
jgi:hypothetical protein